MSGASEVPEDVLRRLVALNEARRLRSAGREDLESWFRSEFGADEQLAVYGSLAPGRVNEHVLRNAIGEWRADLHTEGELSEIGWGANLGFNALRWVPGGGRVPVHLLRSMRLDSLWRELDAFEGPGYIRILVPLFDDRGFVTVANLYEGAAQ